jgi:hypothetical protein
VDIGPLDLSYRLSQPFLHAQKLMRTFTGGLCTASSRNSPFSYSPLVAFFRYFQVSALVGAKVHPFDEPIESSEMLAKRGRGKIDFAEAERA